MSCFRALIPFVLIPALGVAAPALAQSASETLAPQGVLGPDHPANQERASASLLRNFVQMDTNRDFLLSPNEWESWSGWMQSPPPDFASVDADNTSYVSFREYEAAAQASGDSRMSATPHGAEPLIGDTN